MAHKDITPILVTVVKGNWLAHGLTDTPTPRDLMLFQTLQEQGGISDTVEPGEYYYNVVVKNGVTYAMLDKMSSI